MVCESSGEATLSFGGKRQAFLRLSQLASPPVRHETAFGRVAFAVPSDQLQGIQDAVKQSGGLGGTVITELVKLDTPGKATVQVVILGDPVSDGDVIAAAKSCCLTLLFFSQDGYEICFVGEEGFGELSRVDPEADRLLSKAMEEDKSKEWFAKKGLKKEEA